MNNSKDQGMKKEQEDMLLKKLCEVGQPDLDLLHAKTMAKIHRIPRLTDKNSDTQPSPFFIFTPARMAVACCLLAIVFLGYYYNEKPAAQILCSIHDSWRRSRAPRGYAGPQ